MSSGPWPMPDHCRISRFRSSNRPSRASASRPIKNGASISISPRVAGVPPQLVTYSPRRPVVRLDDDGVPHDLGHRALPVADELAQPDAPDVPGLEGEVGDLDGGDLARGLSSGAGPRPRALAGEPEEDARPDAARCRYRRGGSSFGTGSGWGVPSRAAFRRASPSCFSTPGASYRPPLAP